jgi:hypothetical protein
MTDASIRACGTVLAEANATPIGWRSASPDLGSGRCMLATIESTAHQNNQDQISAKRGVSMVRGGCHPPCGTDQAKRSGPVIELC